jgi:hypothetical protein
LAVAKNDSGTPNIASGSSVTTLDLTTFGVAAGSNLLLVAAVYVNGSTTTPTATWDSGGTNQAMTLVPTSPASNAMNVFLYILIAPTVGTKTLHVAGIGTRVTSIGAIAFSGADQTTGIVTADTVKNTGTTVGGETTGAVTSTATGATVGAAGLSGTSIDSTTTGTTVWALPLNYVMSYILGGTSNTHSWGSTHSGSWAVMGIHVIAAAAAGHGWTRQSLAPGSGVPSRQQSRWRRRGWIVVPDRDDWE